MYISILVYQKTIILGKLETYTSILGNFTYYTSVLGKFAYHTSVLGNLEYYTSKLEYYTSVLSNLTYYASKLVYYASKGSNPSELTSFRLCVVLGDFKSDCTRLDLERLKLYFVFCRFPSSDGLLPPTEIVCLYYLKLGLSNTVDSK